MVLESEQLNFMSEFINSSFSFTNVENFILSTIAITCRNLESLLCWLASMLKTKFSTHLRF